MKKAILALIFTLGLAACGSTAAPAGTENAPASAQLQVGFGRELIMPDSLTVSIWPAAMLPTG